MDDSRDLLRKQRVEGRLSPQPESELPSPVLNDELRLLRRTNEGRETADSKTFLQQLLPFAQALRISISLDGLAPRRRSFRVPVVILAGGTATRYQTNIDRFRSTVLRAFHGVSGTIISGGTQAGIAGLAGEIAFVESAVPGGRLEVIGYIPKRMLTDELADSRYSEFISAEGDANGVVHPLQYWTDLITAGIKPAEVRVLAIDGGDIALFEYRLALALGAWVGVMTPPTRAAAALLEDQDWRDCSRLLPLPDDPESVRAFVSPARTNLSAEQIEFAARKIHAAYLEEEHHQNPGPALPPWETLTEDLRSSNRMQASGAAALLEQAGFRIDAAPDFVEPVELTAEEIERLAEMEHGRWVVERLQQGWRYNESRVVEQKLHPDILPWKELAEAVKERDRNAARHWPKMLAQAGFAVRRVG